MESGVVDESRDAVFSGRERHSSSRFNSLGYPQRSIRTHDYLYIHNFRSERWPAGPSQKFEVSKKNGSDAEFILGPMHGGYHDIDACPSLSFLIDKRDDAALGKFLGLAVDLRPAEELFDVRNDPGCLHNLAGDPKHEALTTDLRKRLLSYLRETDDARVVGSDAGDIWETYPRYSSLRWFPTPAWATQQPDRVPEQNWLEAKRPK